MITVLPCIILVLLVSCVDFVSTTCEKDSGVEYNGVKVYDFIVKPEKFADLIFRGIIFPNGFKCLLIYSKNAEMSAVSLDVDSGSTKDFRNVQGTAHYVEHR